MEFQLLREKLKNDIAATQMYRSKLECHETLLYHAKVEHTRKRRLQALDAVEELFKGAVAKFSFTSTVEHALNGLLQLKKEYRVDRLPILLMVNWASPSTIRDEQMQLQVQVLQQILGQEDFEPMGLVVMPVWERAKGSLYKSETLLLKSLSEKEINMDEKASLSFEDVLSFKNLFLGFHIFMFTINHLYNIKLVKPFFGGVGGLSLKHQERADPRDRRPLEYPLRLAFPMRTSSAQQASPWQRCSLFQNNRTSSRAKMMLTKDMRLPESEEDLPSTDLEQRVSMAERYSQLGESAAGALLASTLGSLPAGHPCCVLLDASPKSGEFARTVLKSPESSTAWHYVALAPENQLDWAQQDLKDFAMELYLMRSLKIKAMEPLPETLAADETPQVLVPKLAIGIVDGVNLVSPPDLVGKWAASSFKDEWAQMQEDMESQLPPRHDLSSMPKAKRQRVDSAPQAEGQPVTVKAISGLDATKMMVQASGVGKLKGLTFQLYPSNVLVLLNPTASDVAVTGHLTSWHKGRWWTPKEAGEGFDPALDLVWKFTSSSDILILDGMSLTLHQALEDMKKTKPEKALLRYHILKDNPQGCHGPGDFDIELKHEVGWRAERATVEGDTKKQNPATLAALVPADAWDLNAVQILWTSRWAKQGLTGIKPMVWLKGSVVIPPEHYVQLTVSTE